MLYSWARPETKILNEKISTEIIPEFEDKLKKLPVKKNQWIRKVLIATNGTSDALKKSRYFDQILEIDGMF